MKLCKQVACIAFILIMASSAVLGQDAAKEGAPSIDAGNAAPADILNTLIGSWEGTCRTWFEPGKLADESGITGSFSPILDGRFIRHEYEGTLQGKPRRGEEMLVFNSVTNRFEMTWIDDFHMNYSIMASEGEGTGHGFAVTGKYDVAPGTPPWGWKTVFDILDNDHLVITAYNISPEGEEAKAVETVYTRINR